MLPETKKDSHLIKVLKSFYCYFVGHFYRPAYRMCGSKAQYTCIRCGVKTHWLKRKEHLIFQSEKCPTWGEFGSDSQGYKNINLTEEKNNKPRRDRKRRKQRKNK